MIFDVIKVMVLGHHKPHRYKMAKLTNVVCVLTVPWTSHFPIPPPLFGCPYPLRHNNIKSKPSTDPTMAFKFQGKESCTSLPLTQKL